MPFDAAAELEPPDGETELPPHQKTNSLPASVQPLPPVIFASGEKAKARDIIAAIRTLKNIEKEHRTATQEERKALAHFTGFGPVALSIFPDPVTGHYKDASWQEVGEELKSLLTPAEYDSAKRSTFNAFYTSPVVIAAMHDAIKRFGVPADALILEPGCGSGNFMAHAPAGMQFIGVELDPISGRIAQVRFPNQQIRIEPFQKSVLPKFDAVIGNVPFADLKLDYQGQKLSLHDYFFAKSVDQLAPGGILALVTSHFTMDKQNAAIREYLAGKADFIGAIRLPSDAFKREGTAVVTDIIFLRKRASYEMEKHADPDWPNVEPVSVEGTEVAINSYFVKHPEMVLGTYSRKNLMYGNEGYSVQGSGDLAQQLKAAVQLLPECSPFPSSKAKDAPAQTFTPPPMQAHIDEGSFFVNDDRTICQLQNGNAVPVSYGGNFLTSISPAVGIRLSRLIKLRDLARRVLQSQNEGWPEADRHEARRQLNDAYDRFVYNCGPINKTTFSETQSGTVIRRMPNLAKFREDPDAMLVMSLEDYDEVTGIAEKAAIMKKDVVGKSAPITKVKSAEEGLLVSLNERGIIDLAFIETLYGKPQKQIVSELGDLIYHDPETDTFVTSDEYLSGNVRAKLIEAEAVGFKRNIEALKAVQPEDVLPGDIDANLGAPWIPESDIQAFAAELFHVEPSAIQVGHLKKDALWSIEADSAAERSVAATSEYGTPRANGTWLFELALNMKTPVIYDTVHAGDKEEKVVNQEATLAAREKQKQIKEKFRSWAFSDPERTERLVRLYNDTYNNIRLRLFDGSHLDFPGMNKTIELRPHQKDAIWRGMSSGNTLLGHAVGAGKTFTMAAIGMKKKQAGLCKKPVYVVPNHMLEQFAREFMQLYPNAKLLVAGKEDFTKERRKLLTARIASGEWDGIIMTHSSFERVGMSRGFQEEFLKEQIAEYDQLLKDGASKNATRTHRNLIKTIEKQKAKREERLKELAAEDKKDDGLVFDELGVDDIYIDEAHYFKNLETPTKMERVAGIQTGGSERAFDLYMKARYLGQLHPGHGVTFATGTPISNTMVEMYTMNRFLDPEGMRQCGIEHFDGWAATFGEVIDTMEIAPDGASLRPRSRFAKFVNLPELQQMFRAFADVQTPEMLNLPRPKLETGKAIVVACPMSDEQYKLQQELVERYDRLRTMKIDPREDNALSITTDGRKLALDGRMLSNSAKDFAGSKVNALVDNVAAIWKRTETSRGTQMIFSDMGVNPTPWRYCVYDDLTQKLIARGIPRAQIASIGDADSDAKKQALFDKVRSGAVRVLIGSTAKMGTGTNVQKRLVALHHLDAPWKPAEVEQREGRILRQKNENTEVAIYRYVTQGSFDAFMWQTLETKAKFIAQVMTGENSARRAEDVGSQELSYAEVKAIASGNPAVLTLAETEAELKRLSILEKNHADEQYVARRSIRDLPASIELQSRRLSELTADAATANAHADDWITIGKTSYANDEAAVVLGHSLDRLPKDVYESRRVPLGVYQGLKFGLILQPQFSPLVYLEGKTARTTMLSRDHHGPRAVLNAVERLAGGYASECESVRQNLAIAESQLRDYRTRLGAKFSHDAYLTELTALRDQLKAGLSATNAGTEDEPRASVSELAQQIKTLRSAHTIDAAPERVGKRRSSVEPSVTSRIRQRAEKNAASIQAADEPNSVVAPADEMRFDREAEAPDRKRVARGR